LDGPVVVLVISKESVRLVNKRRLEVVSWLEHTDQNIGIQSWV
jgi:hypothetical protein